MSRCGSGHKLTLEECQRRVRSVSKNITILEYVSSSVPVRCRCELCGHIWTEPSKNLYRGSNCPKCFKRKKNNWTTSEFINAVKSISPNILLSGEYVNMDTRFDCTCSVCGHTWTSVAKNLLSGKGCDKCAHRYVHSLQTKSTEEFMAEMKRVNPNIQIVGEYAGAKKHIECHCKICGHNWTQPTNLLQGYGCPGCWSHHIGDACRKSHDEFVADLNRLHPGITVVSHYTRGADKIILRCNECGEQWSILASSAMAQACGCPTCNGSHGEQAIAAHLHEMGITYHPQHRFSDLRGPGGGYLSYDFYVPSANTLIEYQGEFHDGSGAYQTPAGLENQKLRDAMKKDYASEHGYRILEIWYYDFKRIRSILEDKLFPKPVA